MTDDREWYSKRSLGVKEWGNNESYEANYKKIIGKYDRMSWETLIILCLQNNITYTYPIKITSKEGFTFEPHLVVVSDSKTCRNGIQELQSRKLPVLQALQTLYSGYRVTAMCPEKIELTNWLRRPTRYGRHISPKGKHDQITQEAINTSTSRLPHYWQTRKSHHSDLRTGHNQPLAK